MGNHLCVGKLSWCLTSHPTQPGHRSVGRCGEYQWKLGSKQAHCMMLCPGICGLAVLADVWLKTSERRPMCLGKKVAVAFLLVVYAIVVAGSSWRSVTYGQYITSLLLFLSSSCSIHLFLTSWSKAGVSLSICLYVHVCPAFPLTWKVWESRGK